ncbi:MAG: hypothetical protein H7A53_05830 [Akkermansiaceae bacterium]|nr:hypothetical protein [Akkermansiaceae bacterium]
MDPALHSMMEMTEKTPPDEIRAVEHPSENELDLRLFPPNGVRSLLPEYFQVSASWNAAESRVVHGLRGTGSASGRSSPLLDRLPEGADYQTGDTTGGDRGDMGGLAPLERKELKVESRVGIDRDTDTRRTGIRRAETTRREPKAECPRFGRQINRAKIFRQFNKKLVKIVKLVEKFRNGYKLHNRSTESHK